MTIVENLCNYSIAKYAIFISLFHIITDFLISTSYLSFLNYLIFFLLNSVFSINLPSSINYMTQQILSVLPSCLVQIVNLQA